jgi:hypothetical protein
MTYAETAASSDHTFGGPHAVSVAQSETPGRSASS